MNINLSEATPKSMVLLNAEQHQKVILDRNVNLIWFNLGVTEAYPTGFHGPYISPKIAKTLGFITDGELGTLFQKT